MSLVVVTADELSARPDRFDALIDARSPAEFAEDHLPGAVNWPVLDDDERRSVGTEYKQISAFDARKRGAAMVARRIAEHLEAHVLDRPREWVPLVYCWRGGQRSGTLAWFLDQIGFRTHVLRGGYKAFRAVVRHQLADLPTHLSLVVIAGRTGSGKTRLLQALDAEGAQVLDLEGLARHRGSVLGGLPQEGQPSQKAFEMAIWHALSRFDASRPVFVESESRKIGQLHLPDALIERMRGQGRCVMVDLPDHARIRLLLDEYGFFAQQVERFCGHLESLVELCGRQTVSHWQSLARAGAWPEVFGELMQRHYDPLYLRSMPRNFTGMEAAHAVALPDAEPPTLAAAARSLVAWAG